MQVKTAAADVGGGSCLLEGDVKGVVLSVMGGLLIPLYYARKQTYSTCIITRREIFLEDSLSLQFAERKLLPPP